MGLLQSAVPIPGWWKSRPSEIESFLKAQVSKGQVRSLCTSPGNRPVYLVAYGRAEPELKGTANYNSAMAAKAPEAYYKRQRNSRKRPVLLLLAGTHGQEFEGMVGMLSIASIMETGNDLQGKPQSELRKKLDSLRLLIIPLANPDGRERVLYDGWVGLPTREMTKVGQGTRKDGSLYGWPGCKAVHPMKGDVGLLGGYFDDAGVNMMHDEWAAPMSQTTRKVLELSSSEGPNLAINFHSHQNAPAILSCAYVPVSTKETIRNFAQRFCAALDKINLPHGGPPQVKEDGPAGEMPPAFNLTSMLHHTGCSTAATFESPHGLADGDHRFTYEDILAIQHTLVDTAAHFLLQS